MVIMLTMTTRRSCCHAVVVKLLSVVVMRSSSQRCNHHFTGLDKQLICISNGRVCNDNQSGSVNKKCNASQWRRNEGEGGRGWSRERGRHFWGVVNISNRLQLSNLRDSTFHLRMGSIKYGHWLVHNCVNVNLNVPSSCTMNSLITTVDFKLHNASR